MLIRELCGRPVPAIGLGCMNLSHAYGHPPEARQAREVLEKALDLGILHFDSAALYGFGQNEKLVGPFLKSRREQILLASKCGMRGIDGTRVIDNDPRLLRKDIEDSLARLDTDVIDLFYLHRWDQKIPISDSIGEMSRFVDEGKVRWLGLSEVSAERIREAHAVHPIAAVQSEYSLWSRNVEIAVLDTCRELGIDFVAFSPLARGFLTGVDVDPEAFSDRDIRRNMPRFQSPHFEKNATLLPAYREIAAEADCTPAQLALAWVLHHGPFLHAIPGTTSPGHLEEDVGAMDVELSEDIVERLNRLINQDTVEGARYMPLTQAEIDTEEFA